MPTMIASTRGSTTGRPSETLWSQPPITAMTETTIDAPMPGQSRPRPGSLEVSGTAVMTQGRDCDYYESSTFFSSDHNCEL